MCRFRCVSWLLLTLPFRQSLIEDIKFDCDVARNSLDREAWALRETGNGTLDGSWLVREG